MTPKPERPERPERPDRRTSVRRPDALAVRVDRELVRTTYHSSRYVVAELVAPPAPPTTDGRQRPAATLAFVLDRSGSMAGRKIELAREAVRQAIERLGARDRFSLVVYDDHIDVVMPTTLATPEARREALDRLGRIDARGSTDLGSGWLRGAEQVAERLDREGVNRVLLLTDGLANVGMTDPDELIHHAAQLRERGIATSTFGLGNDFNEALLQGMASAGGGSFRYIERAEQIPDHLAGEVGEALEVTARDVALEVTTPDGLRVDTLTPRPLETHGNRTLVRLGDLVSDQLVRVILRIGFPMGEPGREIGALIAVTDRDGAFGAEPATVTWRYADNPTNDRQPRDREVDRVVARTYADRALSDVVALNRQGRYDEARHLLLGVARRIRQYAGHDAVLVGIVEELEREADHWSVRRTELARKAQFAQVSYSMNLREASGAAMRRPPSPRS
jgi:Ca-activated chloride channel family protein